MPSSPFPAAPRVPGPGPGPAPAVLRDPPAQAGDGPAIRTGHSCAPDPRQAVLELHAALAQPNPALVLFFCSSDYDLDALGTELTRRFPGVPLAGCTTAGELG